ncbi:peptidoglycan/LPS O-acetylase OafA/YrhL [Methanofollis sp. W23]|uniref:acyltransferase family protein n=1 Tax=Methanofollis sp. W23 TaxID=2817849 RepID=UPI001AE498D5|nr:acyltransferase [Methanofollis sp. W23]MBP2146763.1 peptidoglycan/LPS O-acetylase OafA/YrhL [Methanofollis sp. W23]
MTSARHENNFDLLRLSSALVIIISHAYALQIGYESMYRFDPMIFFGTTALASLFVTSGYLISLSWTYQPDLKRFMWKRILRVFPGLIPAIIFTLIIIGPIATTFSFSEYFIALLSPESLMALPFFNNGACIGLFDQNPVTFVNASLWTIPVEFGMYILVAFLGVIGCLRKKGVILGLILVNFLIWILFYPDPSLSKVRFTLYFLIGAYLALHHSDHQYHPAVACILAGLLIVAASSPLYEFAALIAVPYLVLCVAHLKIPALNRFGKKGDFSYGVYIYAYPIQQTLIVLLGTALPLWLYCLLTIGLTFPLAYLSWNLIEKKALALKQVQLTPGRFPWPEGRFFFK